MSGGIILYPQNYTLETTGFHVSLEGPSTNIPLVSSGFLPSTSDTSIWAPVDVIVLDYISTV